MPEFPDCQIPELGHLWHRYRDGQVFCVYCGLEDDTHDDV